MSKLRLFASVLVAGSILATPAISQQRKSLFQVLFPKAHEQRMQRSRARQEELRRQQLLQARQNLPRVKTSRNYVYKVAALAPITIVPLKVEFAAIESEDAETPVATPEPSRMTQDLIDAGKVALKAEKHLAKAVSAHYSKDQEYFWITESGEWNARARSVFKVLEDADRFGLRKGDYKVNVAAPIDGEENEQSSRRLNMEIAMSVAALRYAMDAEYGTVNPNRLSGYHDFPEREQQSPEMLDKLLGGALPANTLAALHPTNDKFAALREELASLKAAKDDLIELPRKVLIKPGQRHLELPNFVDAIKKRGTSELLEKHKPFLSNYLGEVIYTKETVALVKDYQREAGLGADGIIGRNTATKLAGISSDEKVMTVKLAMERLRWLPDELGSRHVFINQPEYRARYIQNGEENLSMRVVVGKKSNQTNFFYDEIEHVEFNPYWNVPRSIIVNEFAPKSMANPGYLDAKGYEVAKWGGKRISSSSIDWWGVGTQPKFSVRQPPGPRNALGQLKIMFPNKHSIYMHDTPAKNLFNKQHRAFSHGCIRLHDPHAMAAAVLGKNKRQVKASVATGKNHQEKLSAKVPVYISYFTAWPQADGSVKYFRDMYGRDAHLIKAMEATQKVRAASITS